jgi:hypothetical protein
MPNKNKHVIQVYLSDDEYEFLKRGSQLLNKSLAQTLLYMADFKQRMIEEADENAPIKIKGLEIPPNPFEDCEEY